MNKASFFGLALIAIGILALAINYQFPTFQLFSNNVVSVNQQEIIEADQVKKIEINTSSEKVSIYPTDNDDITVELTGSLSEKLMTDYSLDVKINKDTLRIQIKNKQFSFGLVTVELHLDVYLPEKLYETITVSSSSGKIIIDDVQGKMIHVKASSGKIEANNLIVENTLKLEASSGRIEARNTKAKTVIARASSGSITLEDVVTDKINANSSSGKIELINTEGIISATASSGKVIIQNESLHNDIEVSTSSGKVEMKFEETPTSALIDYTGSSGKGTVTIKGINYEEKSTNRILGSIGSGDHKVKVRTSSGGFELN